MYHDATILTTRHYRSASNLNALDMGIDIRSVMEAGGWRSLAIFLGI